MKHNRYVSVEKPAHGTLVIRKSRGVLTLDDIYEVLTSEDIEDSFVLHIRGRRFIGWNATDDEPTVAVLHNLNEADTCPTCAKSWEEMREQLYKTAYQDGYDAGLGEFAQAAPQESK